MLFFGVNYDILNLFIETNEAKRKILFIERNYLMRGKNKIKKIERYYSFSNFLKEKFNKKVYKISLSGGMTCPNRDGTIGTRGCIFCSQGGSGDFACDIKLGMDQAIEEGKRKVKAKTNEDAFIAYFQSYTNTYAPRDYLKNLFLPVIMRDDIVALAIGTRPDCLSEEIIELIDELNKIKPVLVELGLQTIHENTALFIRRGYPLSTFDEAVEKLKAINVHTVVHLILGLPGESEEMILQSVDHLAKLRIDGVKLQLLHVLKDTDLAEYYLNGNFQTLEKEEYFELLAKCVERLPKTTVIHRLTGDAPKKLLISPLWSANKKEVLNGIYAHFEKNNVIQGKNCKY